MAYKKYSKLSLWVTCPACKKVFGISPETIEKYKVRVAKMKEVNNRKESKDKKKES